MNDDLRRLVHDRLSSEGLLQKNWSSLVLAACDGRDAVESLLLNAKAAARPSAPAGDEEERRRLSHFPDRSRLQRHRTEADPHVHSGAWAHDRHRPQWVWEVELRRSAGSAVHGRQQALVGPFEDLEGRMAQSSSGASGGHRSRSAAGGARPRQESPARGTMARRLRRRRRSSSRKASPRPRCRHSAGKTPSSPTVHSFRTTSSARCWTKDHPNCTTRSRWSLGLKILSTLRRRSRRAASIANRLSTLPISSGKRSSNC